MNFFTAIVVKPTTTMGGRKLPGRPKNPPSAPSAKDTTSRNRDAGSTGTPSLRNRGAGLSSKIGNVGGSQHRETILEVFTMNNTIKREREVITTACN